LRSKYIGSSGITPQEMQLNRARNFLKPKLLPQKVPASDLLVKWSEQQATRYSWDALLPPAVFLFEGFPLCKND